MLARFKGLLALALVISACTAAQHAAQAGDRTNWTVLTDGSTFGEFSTIGHDNWRSQDGALVADASINGAPSYLVSAGSYSDFDLYVEFYASNDANSGVFLRCQDRADISDLNCYEVNIFDQRPDPSYGTGAIVRHVEVGPMPKAGGRWNSFEISARGRDITVKLNGRSTARLRSGLFSSGFIALQHGGGTIKFRRVEISSN
ncbi:MAG: DUF1080 domain-containing protein [Pseudomonadota bacterium]